MYKKRKLTLMKGTSKAAQVPGVTRSTSLLVNTLPKVAGRELKFYDQDIAGYLDWANSAGDYVVHKPYQSITQDASANGRVGNKVFPKGLEIRLSTYLYQQHPTELDFNGGLFRVIVVEDTQTNGAAMTPSDLLTIKYDGLNLMYSASPYNMANHKRFKVFKDEVISITPQEYAAATRSTYKSFKYMIPIKDTVEINNTDGAITGFKSNNYYVLLLADGESTTTANYLRYMLVTRAYYTDA